MSTSPKPAIDTMRTSMAKTNELFNTEVIGKRNFGALDDIYTANARVLPPNAAMVTGRPAIKAFWSDLITTVNAKSAVLKSVEVIPAGDGAIEVGVATLTVDSSGQTSEMDVKYVVHWARESGKWKWNVDIWNANS